MMRRTIAQDMENDLLDSNDGYSQVLWMKCSNKQQVCCLFVSYALFLSIGFVWGDVIRNKY